MYVVVANDLAVNATLNKQIKKKKKELPQTMIIFFLTLLTQNHCVKYSR